ncbi:hypothetical protein [Natrarchaeobaculum sulfurireducens]|uniref:Uncharacterized protein n=1 Tax=Natrarchaeobaculum sulfurireducens TaxID=2044521 RepID=A0A346PMP1_9EURY|nr:hypothetical protein [Natrarchaeobaculum sulfurireducens]AXR80786.1 hypothetical protein AArcMg_0764 [Natrarchaeobaculum sulfurireducens]
MTDEEEEESDDGDGEDDDSTEFGTTDINTSMDVIEDNQFNPRIGYLVDPDEDVAIATLDRESVSKNYNEETGTRESMSSTTVKVDPTTREPKLEFEGARTVDDDALKQLGVYVETDDGLQYRRGEEREFDALELWWFDADEDAVELDGEDPDKRERFEACTVNIDSDEVDETSMTVSFEVDVEGAIYGHYDPAE